MPASTKPLSRVLTSRRFGFWLLAALWFVGTIVLYYGAYKLKYAMTNIDGISYIRIAELWAQGYPGEAINAYWSPMISWSMLPFMKAGADSQYAFMLASATWSSIGIAAGTWFIWRRTHGNLFLSLAMLITTGVLYAGNLMNLTPDLLSVTWVILFVWALSSANNRLDTGTVRDRVLSGVVLGVVCVIGYLIKQFLVPVFVVVLIGWLVVRFLAIRKTEPAGANFRTRVKPLLWLPAAAIVTMIVVAAPWVTTLSIKYGGPTIGSSFTVNSSTKLEPGGDTKSPAYTLELAPPPTSHAISYAEDRTYDYRLPDASIAANKKVSLVEGVSFYVSERAKSLAPYLSRVSAIAPFAMVIVSIFLLMLVFRILSPRRHKDALIVASTYVVYFLGYLGIINPKGGNLRYYWPLVALSTMVALLLWPSLWRWLRQRGHWWERLVAVLLLSLIPIAAVSQMGVNRPYPFSQGRSFAAVFYLTSHVQKPDGQVFAEKLRDDGIVEPGSRVVSGTGEDRRTLIYVFYIRAQIWGRDVPHDITDPAYQQVLKDNKIQYYFLYQPVEQPVMDVSAFGSIKKSYVMPYSCGTNAGAPSAGCRLSIVSINY